jgi:regulation of enolase protein 1 (concanavalin A-like superfamily)
MPPTTRAVRFRLDGDLALWIEGLHGFYRQLHGYYYKDSEHNFRTGRVRLTGNSLLVQRGPVLVRLEGEFGLAEATTLARTLRPSPD